MIKITNKIKFSYQNEPLIISEISGNHGGCKKKFLKLIKIACVNSTDLIKIQTYEPKDITLKKNENNFKIGSGLWKGKNLWDLYEKACTPFSWHADAFKIAKNYNKVIFSSPFSIRAVDLLEKLGCKLYKIASFEITDFKLIEYIASKNKPIIISTGMASLKEVNNAINIINKYHKKIIILHCVSSYPTQLKDINLQRINLLKKKFPNYMIGISDHTDNIFSSIAATTFGVVAIEKHFKLNQRAKTADAKFSILPEQLKTLKMVTQNIFKSLTTKKNNTDKINKKLRRSIYAKTNIKKNQKLTKKNIETLRPYIGICASKYFKIINKKSKKNHKIGDPIFDKNVF